MPAPTQFQVRMLLGSCERGTFALPLDVLSPCSLCMNAANLCLCASARAGLARPSPRRPLPSEAFISRCLPNDGWSALSKLLSQKLGLFWRWPLVLHLRAVPRCRCCKDSPATVTRGTWRTARSWQRDHAVRPDDGAKSSAGSYHMPQGVVKPDAILHKVEQRYVNIQGYNNLLKTIQA